MRVGIGEGYAVAHPCDPGRRTWGLRTPPGAPLPFSKGEVGRGSAVWYYHTGGTPPLPLFGKEGGSSRREDAGEALKDKAPIHRVDRGADFRETIFWQPQVKTGKDGKTTVTFYLSDGVTSFRIFSEGIGGGVAGRDETVIKSSLPFSML